jgi:hypothetical protein
MAVALAWIFGGICVLLAIAATVMAMNLRIQQAELKGWEMLATHRLSELNKLRARLGRVQRAVDEEQQEDQP